MDHFPIFLNLRDRRALLIGGGALAARKAALIAKSGARITVLADHFSKPMQALALENAQLELLTQTFSAAHLDGVALVLAATDDENLNQRVYAAAQLRGIPVNVADRPELCSYILPAIIDRAPVVVAVSTGGRSPVLARFVKTLLERALPLGLGDFAQLLKRWRAPVAATLRNGQQRRRFWEQLINGAVGQSALSGDAALAEQQIAAALARDADPLHGGSLAFIGAPEHDPELLSIKAHRLIQQAEWLIYDDDTPAALLELSRREGHALNADRQSQAEVLAIIVTQCARGQRVVRLYGRDSALCQEAHADQRALQEAGLSPLTVAATHPMNSPLPPPSRVQDTGFSAAN